MSEPLRYRPNSRPYTGGERMRFASIFLLLEFLAGFGPHRAYATGTPLRMGTFSVRLEHDGCRLAISLRCPRFVLDGQTLGGTVPVVRHGAVESGRPAEIDFAPLPLDTGARLEVRLH